MKIIESFTDLEKANAYVTSANAELKSLGEKVTAGEDQLKLAKQENAEIEKSLVAALDEVGTLSLKLSLQEAHGADGKIVLIGKKSFTLVGDSFVYGGSVKTADQLSIDMVELKRMLEIGSGALVPLD